MQFTITIVYYYETSHDNLTICTGVPLMTHNQTPCSRFKCIYRQTCVKLLANLHKSTTSRKMMVKCYFLFRKAISVKPIYHNQVQDAVHLTLVLWGTIVYFTTKCMTTTSAITCDRLISLHLLQAVVVVLVISFYDTQWQVVCSIITTIICTHSLSQKFGFNTAEIRLSL